MPYPSVLMIRASLSRSVMRKISFPRPSFSGSWSNFRENALWNSLGSRAANSGFSVMIRTSDGVNVLQYSSTP